MGPLNIFTKILKKDSPGQNYLSLVVTPDRVVACIWVLNFDQVEFLGFGQKSITDINSLRHQATIAIDTAAQNAKSDVTKIVFGLSNFYLEDNQPSREVSKIIKNLASDLELSPQAFIPLAAAINHLLKIEESATPHAVLIGVFNDFCEVHIIKNNKVIATYTSKEKITIDKIENLISRLKDEVENLPSRFIVYGIKDPGFTDKIIKADWKDLFIHEPKIMILDANQLAKSVAYAQAADILGHDPTLLEITKGHYPSPVKSKIEKINEFGFVEGEDILLTKQQEELERHETSDSAVKSLQPDLPKHVLAKQEKDKPDKEDYAVEVNQTPDTAPAQNYKETLGDIATGAWLSRVLAIFKKRPSVKKIAVAVAGLVIIGFLGSFIASRTLTSAQVIIKVNAKTLEKNFKADVVLRQTESSQIIGQEITTKMSGSQKAIATGTKKLGEKAGGEVTIFNITSTPKSFPKDTTIITKSGLKFVLDEEVEATSAGKPGQPSQTKTRVTASEAGPQYNIDTEQDFSFAQFDEYAYWAHNDTPFSGGSEKQVTVVARQDLDKLEKSLIDSLTEKAKADLKEKISGQKFSKKNSTKNKTKKPP